jgi:WhiB family redox-sensing transcriptional regulator
MNTDWMAGGKCKEVAPDVFFPNDGMGVLVAQRICAECPVSERERRRILRRRRLSHAVVTT